MGRTYTAKETARALEIYVTHGPCRAARETGAKKPTIIRWAKAAGLVPPTENITDGVKAQEARIAAKRAEGKELFADVLVASLKRAKSTDTTTLGVQQLTIAAATALDKLRLEAGEATSNQKVTVDDIAGSRERLAQQLTRMHDRGGEVAVTNALN